MKRPVIFSGCLPGCNPATAQLRKISRFILWAAANDANHELVASEGDKHSLSSSETVYRYLVQPWLTGTQPGVQELLGVHCALLCIGKAMLATSPSSGFPAAAQVTSIRGHVSPLPSDPGSLPVFPRCGFSVQPTAPSLALNTLALCTALCKPTEVTAGKHHSGITVPFRRSSETTVSFLLPPRVTQSALLCPLFCLLGRLHLSRFWMKMKITSSHPTPYHMHKTTDCCTICNLF